MQVCLQVTRDDGCEVWGHEEALTRCAALPRFEAGSAGLKFK